MSGRTGSEGREAGRQRHSLRHVASRSVLEIREDSHVCAVFVGAAPGVVWRWVTDPLNFPTIYPNWTASVEASTDGGYAATGAAGDRFLILPQLDRRHGVIDFEVVDGDGNVELSRSRLFEMKGGGATLIHLAVRWEGVDDAAWERHRRGTEDDLANAKRVIEASTQ